MSFINLLIVHPSYLEKIENMVLNYKLFIGTLGHKSSLIGQLDALAIKVTHAGLIERLSIYLLFGLLVYKHLLHFRLPQGFAPGLKASEKQLLVA